MPTDQPGWVGTLRAPTAAEAARGPPCREDAAGRHRPLVWLEPHGLVLAPAELPSSWLGQTALVRGSVRPGGGASFDGGRCADWGASRADGPDAGGDRTRPGPFEIVDAHVVEALSWLEVIDLDGDQVRLRVQNPFARPLDGVRIDGWFQGDGGSGADAFLGLSTRSAQEGVSLPRRRVFPPGSPDGAAVSARLMGIRLKGRVGQIEIDAQVRLPQL